MTPDTRYLVDLLERAAATYIEALIGLLIASAVTTIDVSTLKAAAISAIPAGLAVVKAGLARFTGNDDSASLAPEV